MALAVAPRRLASAPLPSFHDSFLVLSPKCSHYFPLPELSGREACIHWSLLVDASRCLEMLEPSGAWRVFGPHEDHDSTCLISRSWRVMGVVDACLVRAETSQDERVSSWRPGCQGSSYKVLREFVGHGRRPVTGRVLAKQKLPCIIHHRQRLQKPRGGSVAPGRC
ncbi:hypothetical protein GQ53DRAFT_382110 [Thozetella sp. PMI_491]|nr:hypothetical protein GQ53DRAFT_382110 [Thozetella sp. PMI_491]